MTIKSFVLTILLLLIAISPALAGQAENIIACTTKVKEFANISLNESDATYEGHLLEQSIVRWDKIVCEVKSGDVSNLTINGIRYIYEYFPGKTRYDLNEKLKNRTEHTIDILNSTIALLKERMRNVTLKLMTNNVEHEVLLEEIINLNRMLYEDAEQTNQTSEQTTQIFEQEANNAAEKAAMQAALIAEQETQIAEQNAQINQLNIVHYNANRTEVLAYLNEALKSGNYKYLIDMSEKYLEIAPGDHDLTKLHNLAKSKLRAKEEYIECINRGMEFFSEIHLNLRWNFGTEERNWARRAVEDSCERSTSAYK